MAVSKKKKQKIVKPKKILKKKVVRVVKNKIVKKIKKVAKKTLTNTKKKTKTKTKAKVLKKNVAEKNILNNTKLKRFVGNPIIHPANGMHFESRATFNPTAFLHDGKVHIIYRAVGESDISTLGYAGSLDGYNFRDRTFRPIFIHQNKKINKEEDFLSYGSGGGWNGGAEDPRITKIDDMLHMTYTAFDGWGSVRIGYTSISLSDFLNKKWDWKEPVLISPPGEMHKNWAIFPEKINGKFAILHSISPDIGIEYVSDMNSFDGSHFIRSQFHGNPKWNKKVNGIRGIGPAPVKTKYGWLVLYHAMEKEDPNRYKLFAMLLDLKDPTKILYKSEKAILEPDMFYENEGHKWGVVYSCGALIKDGQLFVYYGGADMVSCVATTDLEKFLENLITKKVVKLTKNKNKK